MSKQRKVNGGRAHVGNARPSALLMQLVARARWLWLAGLERAWQALRQWRQARWEARAAKAADWAFRLSHKLETLEPKLLLSADLMPLDAGPAGALDSRLVQDAPTDVGTARAQAVVPAAAVTPSVNLTGAGQAQVVAQDGGFLLQLNGTDTSTVVSLSTSDGSRVALTGIAASGALGSLDLANADLRGRADLAGGVGSLRLGAVNLSQIVIGGAGAPVLSLGQVTDSRVVAAGANLALTVERWASSSAGASRIEAAALKSLTSSGDLHTDLFLSGAASGFTLGAVQVGGSIVGGVWSVQGRASVISAGSTLGAWRLNIDGALTQFITRADASGDLAVASLQLLQVGRDARSLHLLVGADLGDDAALGGTGANADSFRTGTLARVRITGNLIDSSLYVSVDPVNGVLGDGNDRQLGSVLQRVQEFIVGGQLLGSTSVVAPQFPTSVRIAGTNVAPASVSQFRSTPADTLPPSLLSFILAPGSDTGVLGDNRTSAASVTLQASAEAGASYTLRRAGQADPLASGQVAGDGSLSLAGIALALGSNSFELSLRDAAGNATQASLVLVRELAPDTLAPTLQAALANDTGASALDGVTQDAAIAGTATDDVGVTELLVALDPQGDSPAFTNLIASLQPGGSLRISRAQLDALAGGSLADGAHSVRVVAQDAAGHRSSQDIALTLDTTAPAAGFGITAAQADGGDDGRTTAAAVTLTGVTEAGARIDLPAQGLTASAGADGRFDLTGVALAMGSNSISLLVTDRAGNSQSGNRSLVRVPLPDTSPPSLGNLRLQADTGSSAVDRITSTVTVLA